MTILARMVARVRQTHPASMRPPTPTASPARARRTSPVPFAIEAGPPASERAELVCLCGGRGCTSVLVWKDKRDVLACTSSLSCFLFSLFQSSLPRARNAVCNCSLCVHANKHTDAQPCQEGNGGCEDVCFDGVGAHYCQCHNAPLSQGGACQSFCDWAPNVFPDRVVYCSDFATANVGTPISGEGAWEGPQRQI